MAITYFEISYPNFVLGAIIDPEEANQNNHEIVTKVNDIIEANNTNEGNITNLTNTKADLIYVNEKDNANATAITNHKTSTDHDNRYYTKTLLNSGQLNHLYYTKDELTPWLRGGDTSVREEVFKIITSDNGNGTFTYTSDGVNTIIGNLDEEGYQIFKLTQGMYEPGTKRIEAFVNDTLRRSATSGGLKEMDNMNIALSPESSNAEITFKYYERLGMTAEYNIKLGSAKPPRNDGKNMWFEVIS